MKKVLGGAGLLLAVGALIYLFHSQPATPSRDAGANSSISSADNFPAHNKVPSAAAPGPHSNASEIIATTPSPLAANAGEWMAPTNTVADLPPAVVLQNVRHAVRQFGEMFGGNPVGDNAEITAALNGKNPKQLNFIDPAAGLRLNDKGELVDAWNTPYFFHQLSATDMEIHSAGPDRKMWTSDDLVTH